MMGDLKCVFEDVCSVSLLTGQVHDGPSLGFLSEVDLLLVCQNNERLFLLYFRNGSNV